MDKLFSIIIPSYNMESYLPSCLNSLTDIECSSLQLLDIIVVNDGSRDRTGEIAQDFARRFPGVFQVIEKENGHYGSCINAGLKVARGEFVKILDADDQFATEGLAGLVARLRTIGDDIDVVLTTVRKINPEGAEMGTSSVPCEPGVGLSIADLNAAKVSIETMHLITYRMDVFRRIQYIQTTGIPYTDNEFVFYPMSKVNKVFRIPEVVYCYRVGREGQSVDKAQLVKSAHCFLAVAKRMLKEEWLCENVPAANIIYMRIWLLHYLVYVYQLFCFDLPLVLLRTNLQPFDAQLKVDNPAMHQTVHNDLTIRLYKSSVVRLMGERISVPRICILRLVNSLLRIWRKKGDRES